MPKASDIDSSDFVCVEKANSVPSSLPPLYAQLIRDILRNDIRDFTFIMDTSDVPRYQASSISPDEMKMCLPEFIRVFDKKERVTILTARPNLNDPIKGEQMLENDTVDIVISKSINPASDDSPSKFAKMDKRGKDAGEIQNNFRAFRMILSDKVPNEDFKGQSQVFAALLQRLVSHVDSEPSARTDNFIVFSNAYNFADTINGLLDDLCDAIIERPHCQIHFITGDLETLGDNPNEYENGCQTVFHYIKQRCGKNVHIHSLENDGDAIPRLVEPFNNNQDISMEVIRPSCPVRIGIRNGETGENIMFQLRISNQMEKEIPKGGRVYLVGNDYLKRSDYVPIDEAIPPNGEAIYAILCSPRVNKGIDDLPPTMRIVVEVPRDGKPDSFKLLKHVDFKVNVQDYIKNFYDSRSKILAKIQAFGVKGTGKSLWIATNYSMLNEADMFHIPVEQGLKSRDSPNDVTREIVEIVPQNKYVSFLQSVVKQEQDILRTGLIFKDAPGIEVSADSFNENTNEHKRYNNDHIKYLVHGALPTGFKLEAGDEQNIQFISLKKDLNKEYIAKLDEHMIEQRPHAVVFCVTANSLDDQGTANRVKIMLDKFTQEGIPLIVCLTQMDKVAPDLEANPLLSSEQVEQMLQDSASNLGINVDNIIYSVSYGRTPEGKKVFEYDKLHFKNLEKIQRIAEQYATRLREEGNQLTGNAMVAAHKFRKEYEN